MYAYLTFSEITQKRLNRMTSYFIAGSTDLQMTPHYNLSEIGSGIM